MAQWGRDPRLNRRRSDDHYFEREVATDRGRCFRGRPSRATAAGHPGRTTVTGHQGHTAAYRFNELEVTDVNCKAGRKTEKYDYGHGRDRSRSPFAVTVSPSDYRKKQHCETDTLQNESIKITVGNDKFRSPLTAVSRASTQDQHDYTEGTPSITRAREMAMRTREMLSKLTGWTPISLQPLSDDHVNTTERPGLINVSNSMYTKVSASSEMAQSILRNISAVANAFCPKESGGVTHIKYKKPGKMRNSTTDDDDDKFLYGEELIPEKIENSLSGADDKSRLRCLKSASDDQSLQDLAEPSNRKATDNECDPVVANVLKSIGFNFELSKIMQEKAKKEREENEKNRVLIQQASSFLAKQLAGQSHNAKEVSADDSETFPSTRHIGNDLNETRRSKDADILYDDFSNSEDEFSGTEKKKWTASSTKFDLSVGKVWQNLPMAYNSPSGVGLPPGGPSPVSILTTPPPRHPLVATVQPPPPSVMLPLQSSSLVLPPPPLLEANSQPGPPLPPSWPAYQLPLPTGGSLPKWKSKASRVANEVEWEQNTQEFLRKLQEPRTTELPPNREARSRSRSRSTSSSSTSNKRLKKEQKRKRSASKELWSRSHEENIKRQRSERATIVEHRKSCDQVTKKKKKKQLSFLKDKLNCLKKEHSQLVGIKQKSSHTKEKLKLNRHQQDELHADIRTLLEEINCRITEGHSGFVSNDEHSFGRTQQRESKAMTTQRRHSRRDSKEQIRERDTKKSSFTRSELSVEKQTSSSSKVIANKIPKLMDCIPQRELMLSLGCLSENKLVNVEVKDEKSIDIAKELEPRKEKELEPRKENELESRKEKKLELRKEKELEPRKENALKMRANSHGKCDADSVGDEVKEETNDKVDEESLEDKRGGVKSKDETRLQKPKMRGYDYYDGGDNWCSLCSSLFPKLSEFLDHLHCTAHQQVVASTPTYLTDKPWKLLQVLQSKPHNNLPPISEPASGMEFLLPVKGFFCTLCQKYSGDCDDAELHVLSEDHNARFKQHCSDNPTYQKGYRSAKMEKLAARKLDKERTTMEGQIERNFVSCVTGGGNNRPVTRQIKHTGKKLRKASSETTTIVNSTKHLKDVHTQKFLHLKNDLEQNLKAVNGNLLSQAGESLENLTKETAELALFSSNVTCNPVLSEESGQVSISETKIQTSPSCEMSEVENFKTNVKASRKEEPTLEESLQGEADARLEENKNAEKDVVQDIDNCNPLVKTADVGSTKQSDIRIHLVQTSISVDNSESISNELPRNLMIQRTACVLDPVMPCHIANVAVWPKTTPVTVSEVQSVMLQSSCDTRDTNAYEPAKESEEGQSGSTYLPETELDERDAGMCQSQMPSSTEVDERDNAGIYQSQESCATEVREDSTRCQSPTPFAAEVKEDPAICQSQMPSTAAEESIRQSRKPSAAEVMEDHAICQSQMPSSSDSPNICQSPKPFAAEVREDPANCHSQIPSSTEAEERDHSDICQSLKPFLAEAREDPAICQSQMPSSTEAEARKDPAICQSSKSSAAEVRGDSIICELQKPSAATVEEDDAICQSQMPSSSGADERDNLGICQSQKPSAAEVREDSATCQSQMPSSSGADERDNLGICQSQKSSAAEVREVSATCQSQMPSSSEADDREDPAICLS